jgi:hypothetical protein
MRWNVSPALAGEVGEDGPWAWYLKDAWQACATDSPEIHTHRQPKVGVDDWHAKAIAYWAPMFHPLIFGLGWSRPDIGLLRWRDMGYPAVDPILGAVLRWWGKDRVEDLLAWAAVTDVFRSQAEAFMLLTNAHVPDEEQFPDTPEWRRLREQPAWKEAWQGEGDSFHLQQHALAPISGDGEPGRHLGKPDRGPTLLEDPGEGVALLFDTYFAWYRRLLNVAEKITVVEAFPVDVIVKPIGWLGTYRLSRGTNIWHRTEEWIHLLGNEGV